MRPCTDIDLKMSLILSQECELQNLTNQNADLQKILEKVTRCLYIYIFVIKLVGIYFRF